MPTFWRAPDGTRLAVDAQGDGQVVVFQHGLCGDAAQAAEHFPAAPGLRRLTLECRAHGGSDAGSPEAFGIARFTDDLAGVLDETCGGATPAVVGGVSMGAAMALRLAVTRPDLVRALVINRPAWVTEPAPPNCAPIAEIGRCLAAADPATARERFLASETAAALRRDSPDNLASLTGFFDRDSPEVTAALLLAITADGPGVTEAEVAAVTVPALVVGCERDVVHPMAMAERLAALLPNARLAKVHPKSDDRARHFVEVRAEIDQFLSDVG